MAAESELELLRAYVTAPGNSGAKRADSTVLLHVTHSNLKAEFMEIRFDLSVRRGTPSGASSRGCRGPREAAPSGAPAARTLSAAA